MCDGLTTNRHCERSVAIPYLQRTFMSWGGCHTERSRSVCGGFWKYFRFDEVFSPAHCRGLASPFVLKQKDQKFKTEKTFCPQASSRPGFPSGVCALGCFAPILIVIAVRNEVISLLYRADLQVGCSR